jgi:hypothetical protein
MSFPASCLLLRSAEDDDSGSARKMFSPLTLRAVADSLRSETERIEIQEIMDAGYTTNLRTLIRELNLAFRGMGYSLKFQDRS